MSSLPLPAKLLCLWWLLTKASNSWLANAQYSLFRSLFNSQLLRQVCLLHTAHLESGFHPVWVNDSISVHSRGAAFQSSIRSVSKEYLLGNLWWKTYTTFTGRERAGSLQSYWTGLPLNVLDAEWRSTSTVQCNTELPEITEHQNKYTHHHRDLCFA